MCVCVFVSMCFVLFINISYFYLTNSFALAQ